jgi:DnaD/phage-associated family protein
MMSFKGFTSQGLGVEIPANFFSEVLPEISDLNALKILLLAIFQANRSESQVSYFSPESICSQYFSDEEEAFWKGLEINLENDWLLSASISQGEGNKKEICLLNTAKNAAAVEAIEKGEFRLSDDELDFLPQQRPDIFRLYEENIGPLTPIIADSLKDLEENYPADWIIEAIWTAVKNNARTLRYIEVVLQNWQEEGRNDRTDRRRRKKTEEEFDPDRYKGGEFSDFFDNE